MTTDIPLPPPLSLDDRPRVRAGVASVDLDGEVVLLDDEGSVHLLNPTAGLAWACFDGASGIGEIAADVAEVFGAPIDEVQAGILSLADDLLARRLLVLVDGDDNGPLYREAPTAEPVVVQPGSY